jgi:hypothetical protein
MNLWWQLPWIPWIVAVVAVAIGLLGGGYYFWRKAQEEHLDGFVAFDGLIYSALAGFLASRLFYLVLRFDEDVFSIWRVVNVWQHPGLWAPAGLVAAYLVMAWWARRLKRDVFEVWDFYTLVVTWFLGWYWLSRFVVGAAAGISTLLPIGIMFPGRVEPAHPIQVYASVVYLLLFRYLWWSEPRYRFFLWYRSKKRTARSGFILAVFLIVTGLLGVGLGFLQYPFILVFDLDINQLFSVVLFLLGCVLLYARSGQSFFIKPGTTAKGPTGLTKEKMSLEGIDQSVGSDTN